MDNFWGFPHNIQIVLDHQEKLKGKVRKMIYEDEYSRTIIEYDRNGVVSSALYETDTNKDEVHSVFDRKGNLISVKVGTYLLYPTGETKKWVKEYENTLKYRYYRDSIHSYHVVLDVAIDDQILIIDADKINTSKNTRESFYMIINQNQLKPFLEDSNFIKKILNEKFVRLSYEREDLNALIYYRWLYDKNNKPTKCQIFNSYNKDIDEIITHECQYLTEDSGILLGEKSEYNKFVIVNGEAKQLYSKDFMKITNEKFTYDKNGNWVKHTFTSQQVGQKAEKVKIERKIEYWED